MAVSSAVGPPGSCVAGVEAPAFVERLKTEHNQTAGSRGVAGVEAPAFVERGQVGVAMELWTRVSPGWKPRPSLSAGPRRAGAGYKPRCRRGGSPGLR